MTAHTRDSNINSNGSGQWYGASTTRLGRRNNDGMNYDYVIPFQLLSLRAMPATATRTSAQTSFENTARPGLITPVKLPNKPQQQCWGFYIERTVIMTLGDDPR